MMKITINLSPEELNAIKKCCPHKQIHTYERKGGPMGDCLIKEEREILSMGYFCENRYKALESLVKQLEKIHIPDYSI